MEVANCILNIPLFDVSKEDKLVWYDDMHGQYNVESGYNLMITSTGRGEEVSNQDDWNCIWKVDAPPKAKHLLWRICRGCLPTRVRLKERCVPCPLACSFCNYDYEDERHIFFNCHDIIRARITVGLDHVLTPWLQQHSNIKELIMNICKLVDRETTGKFAMLMWVLWKNRNNNVWEGMKESGQNLGSKAVYLWQEWKVVQCSNNNNMQVEMQQQHLHWQRPPYGCKTSAGWCLRDHVGQFVTAGTTWSQGICSIVEGEANALLEAMKEMEHRGFTHVIFETDSKNVADAIHNLRVGNSAFSSLIYNIKNVMSSNPNFVVKFIKRQANSAAHMLARAPVS